MSKKFVYLFSEGDASMRNLLGGKGANLAEMTKLGLPVPQGFTISTEACTQYYDDGKTINPEIEAEIFAAGGILGAEGAVYFLCSGDEEEILRLEADLKAL